MGTIQKAVANIKNFRAYQLLTDLPYWKQMKSYRTYFRQYKIKKRVWQGVSYNDIANHDTENIPWLDKAISLDEIKANSMFDAFSPVVQKEILQWKDKGYMIVPGFFSAERTDELRDSLEGCLSPKELEEYHKTRIQDLWSRNMQVDAFLRDPELLKLLSFILGREVVPFQTLSFYKGSEQPAHSDSIHFTSEPFGYMIAVWVALEDIT
jgi:hypothetical protein